MVTKVRRGWALRAVAREFGVSLSTVQWWVHRAAGQRLDRVNWSDRPPIPRTVRRTPAAVEDQVLLVRQELKVHSALGEFGARAIWHEWGARGLGCRPSVRTIGRILARRGAVEDRRRVRRPAPPRGWYLPAVALGRAELDCIDTIEGLAIRDGPPIVVLTAISLHGGLAEAWPATAVSARSVVVALQDHWRAVGLPAYAQFDNAAIFHGAPQPADLLSRVMRLCVELGVVPVFTPPREQGFQAAIESFNARWQAKVWSRFDHPSLSSLQERSARYVRALRHRAAERIAAAPPRCPFPVAWTLDFQVRPRGVIIFLRRTTEAGTVSLLGRSFPVAVEWPHHLVRAEVDLDQQQIRFFALRRRQPDEQPLLRTVPYEPPRRRFRE